MLGRHVRVAKYEDGLTRVTASAKEKVQKWDAAKWPGRKWIEMKVCYFVIFLFPYFLSSTYNLYVISLDFSICSISAI